jgi:hypothetical protein
MGDQVDTEYYISRESEWLESFARDTQRWKPIIFQQFGDDFAEAILKEARDEFEALIPEIPYIGGGENHLTGSLIKSARCLALYKAMKARGKTAEETGKILYDAIMSRVGEPIPEIPPHQKLTPEQLTERREKRAERTQLRQYPDDWVYEFVAGDGEEFDYGYNFTECATLKFYHAQGADEFLPFYCFLDFPESGAYGLGLSRTMTLAEGHPVCDHRFKKGRKSEQEWPPPFLRPQ